jgi:hypothetical protein
MQYDVKHADLDLRIINGDSAYSKVPEYASTSVGGNLDFSSLNSRLPALILCTLPSMLFFVIQHQVIHNPSPLKIEPSSGSPTNSSTYSYDVRPKRYQADSSPVKLDASLDLR